ncbi:hypothetical protein C0416_04565 [bacterium]|nr:hypothetical protein [bacterium]
MDKLTIKRHYKLLVIFVAAVAAGVFFGGTRIIAYNFGSGDSIKISGTQYVNEVGLFDDAVHEISIVMNNGDYETMINTYKEAGEKDYFHADITIDGIKIENVGIRLKGNLTLSQSLGTKMGNGGGGGENGVQRPERPAWPEGAEMPEGFEPPEGFELPEGVVQGDFPGNPFSGEFEETEGEPPFLIKFDEFVDGQTYQGNAEIAFRISSNNDKALLVEQIAYYIHGEVGQIVPETSYGYVSLPDGESRLYEITEHIDEVYIEKNFTDSEGVLYKAGNFVGFEYLGDDPTLYAENFEQKTSLNDDDLYYLIQFLKFVTQSTDEEFEDQLSNWIDMDSFVRMMALDNLLGNNDSFVGMGSNYYLYYDKINAKFTMLSWDLNLAMGTMGGGAGGGGMRMMPMVENQLKTETGEEVAAEGDAVVATEDAQRVRPEGMPEGFEGKEGGGMGRSGTNLLKERFFANETFSAMYDAEYARLKELVFDGGLAVNRINELATMFTQYNSSKNVMDQSEYDLGVENIKKFFQ